MVGGQIAPPIAGQNLTPLLDIFIIKYAGLPLQGTPYDPSKAYFFWSKEMALEGSRHGSSIHGSSMSEMDEHG